MIKTKNYVQANKLTTLVALSKSITVEVTEYKVLNQTKGVIYCNDLRGIPESEITNELTDQNICEVKKIYKFENKQNVETGLIILTFSCSNLPSDIKIGYQKINVRPYIPLPTKCNNCQQFGHIAKYCKNTKICFHCSNEFHLNPDAEEECTNEINCVNCIHFKIADTKHSSKDKKCPIFIKHKELQAIKTIHKVDNRTAHKMYNERHQHDGSLYSSVANSTNQIILNKIKNNHTPSAQTANSFSEPLVKALKPKLITYDSITESESDVIPPSTSTTIKETKLKILPRTTSKRLQAKLKAASKTTIKQKSNQKNITITDDEEEMDL